MFPSHLSPAGLNEFCKGCMVEFVGIEFTEVGSDYIKATMPITEKTRQPLGLLHGGATVVLAETLGSIAANVLLDPAKQIAVGLEVNANHLKAVKQGYVTGTATAIHIGKSTQVWEIKISSSEGELVATSRITMAILDRK